MPNDVLAKANSVQVSTQYQNQSDTNVTLAIPYLVNAQHAQIQLLPISGDDQLTEKELKQSLVVKGQLAGLKSEDLNEDKPVILKLDNQEFAAKLDDKRNIYWCCRWKAITSISTKTIKILLISKIIVQTSYLQQDHTVSILHHMLKPHSMSIFSQLLWSIQVSQAQ